MEKPIPQNEVDHDKVIALPITLVHPDYEGMCRNEIAADLCLQIMEMDLPALIAVSWLISGVTSPESASAAGRTSPPSR